MLSAMPIVSALGPLLIPLVAFAALRYLIMAGRLREQAAAQQAIQVEMRKLTTAVDQSPASVVITDRKGNIEYVNPAFCRLTGYALHEALGQNPRLLKGEEQPDDHYRSLWETLESGREWRGEFHNKRKDGTSFWELASVSPIRDQRGEITHYVAVKENITERKEWLERLRQMAQQDELTGLPNRALFFDRLGCLQAQSCREGRGFALLFLDLDGFRQINDRLGQEAGDEVLRVTAHRLTSCIRQSDTAARMGGDQFAVILGNLSHRPHVARIAEKILEELQSPIPLPGGAISCVGASVGISMYPEDSEDVETLLREADGAMREMKRKGKSGYRFLGTQDTPRLSLCR